MDMKRQKSDWHLCDLKEFAALYTPQVAWKKSSIHWVCPWGQVSSQGAVT
jgi:hypothetical protein